MTKMKVALVLSLVLALLVVSGGGTLFALASPSSPAPTVVVAPSAVPLSSKAKLVIMGSGFEPGQEINIIVHAKGEYKNNINYLLDAVPEVDKGGAFVAVWTLGGWTKSISKLGDEGIYTIEVRDADYNTLATCPFGLVDTKKEERSEWGKVLLGE